MEIYLIQIYVMLLAEKVFNDMELVILPIKQRYILNRNIEISLALDVNFLYFTIDFQ